MNRLAKKIIILLILILLIEALYIFHNSKHVDSKSINSKDQIQLIDRKLKAISNIEVLSGEDNLKYTTKEDDWLNDTKLVIKCLDMDLTYSYVFSYPTQYINVKSIDNNKIILGISNQYLNCSKPKLILEKSKTQNLKGLIFTRHYSENEYKDVLRVAEVKEYNKLIKDKTLSNKALDSLEINLKSMLKELGSKNVEFKIDNKDFIN